MFRTLTVKGVLAAVGYAVCCVLATSVLVVSGVAHQTLNEVASIGKSGAITGSGRSVGEMNILVMGLESRTDWNDNPLPPDQLGPLHAGSEASVSAGLVGGHTTNTLILIHIFNGGKKAVGFSIPRDDYVNYAKDVGGVVSPATYSGIGMGKIDEAYGDAWAQEEQALYGKGQSHDDVAFQSHEAGRRAAIATVEYLTGVHIDHFAEVNLIGFYELAKVLGGIWVCLKHPVPYDPNSGFFAHHAGLQWLDAKGALAFVRQRHGLPNEDLDRTHRQQAFIDSVIQQLKTGGVLNDLFKLGPLLAAANQYVITDQGWNLTAFATDMAAFSSRNLQFTTAPISAPEVIGGKDVLTVDPQLIQQEIHDAFYPAPASARHARKPPTDPDPALTTVVVENGTTAPTLAAQVSAALAREGYKQGAIADTPTPQSATSVLYGAGAAVAGAAIAAQLGGGVTAQPSSQVTAGTVQILLGPGINLATIAGPAASGSPSPSSTYNPAGGTVSVPANGRPPCVD
jgi:LCP family protein required for cell wall assembly